jgi:hypothetical protein
MKFPVETRPILRVETLTKRQQQLLPPIPFYQLRWQEFSDGFDDRTVRHLIRSSNDFDITSLRGQFHIRANIIHSEIKIP